MYGASEFTQNRRIIWFGAFVSTKTTPVLLGVPVHPDGLALCCFRCQIVHQLKDRAHNCATIQATTFYRASQVDLLVSQVVSPSIGA